MSKIFLSYSKLDSDFAIKLIDELNAKDLNIWIDKSNIRIGKPWDIEIEEALTNCELVLVILSPNSVKSPNVLDEMHFAIEEKKTIIPILYQSCSIPFRLRRLQYVDFSQNFTLGLSNLLSMLSLELKMTKNQSSDRILSGQQKDGKQQIEFDKIENASIESHIYFQFLDNNNNKPFPIPETDILRKAFKMEIFRRSIRLSREDVVFTFPVMKVEFIRKIDPSSERNGITTQVLITFGKSQHPYNKMMVGKTIDYALFTKMKEVMDQTVTFLETFLESNRKG